MERRTELVALSRPQLQAALAPYPKLGQVSSLEPLTSGRANSVYRLETSDGPLVLRLHVRDPATASKERELHELLSDVVPLAPLLASHDDPEPLGHPFSVTRFVEGLSLSRALKASPELKLETAARSLGHMLARLTLYRYEEPGDLAAEADGGLRVLPWTATDFYRHWLFATPAAERLGELRGAVWRLVKRYEHAGAGWPIHLVHGDLNPDNVLLEETGEVGAVLDWEFAHAGRIYMDLGNLLRDRPEAPLPPFFAPALLEGLNDLGVDLPANWQSLALLDDLASACEFLSSAEPRPLVHARALAQVRSTLQRLA